MIFLVYHLNFKVGNQVTSEKSVKLLGINIDNKISFDEHVSSLCKKASNQLNTISRLQRYLSFKEKEVLINSFVSTNLNYCSLIWRFRWDNSVRKIEQIQAKALRILYSDLDSDYKTLLEKSAKCTVKAIERHRTLGSGVFKTVTNLNRGETFCLLLITFCSLFVTLSSLPVAFYSLFLRFRSLHFTIFSLLVNFFSLLVTFCSLFVTFCSLLVTFCLVLVSLRSLLVTYCWLLFARCSLLFVHCLLLFTWYFSLFARCSLLYACWSLDFACCSLLFARCLLLFDCCLLLFARYSLLFACWLLICPWLVTFCSLFITFCSLLVTFWLLFCREPVKACFFRKKLRSTRYQKFSRILKTCKVRLEVVI